MLASIHPLGERARHNRWGLTVAAHLLGSWAGGVAVLGAVALLGNVVRLPAEVAVPVIVLAAAAEARGWRLPGPRRQVNEDWLNRYRGWVYGFGFGVQLGAGLLTIVTTAGLYAALVLAFLAHSVWAGVLAGTAFGLGRALPLLATANVQRGEQLADLHRRMQRAARPVRLTSAVALAVLVLGVR